MKIEHRGFKVTGIVGGLSATVRDVGGYVEIVLDLSDIVDPELSFDLDGWQSLTGDMSEIIDLGNRVQRRNESIWAENQ